MAEAWVTSYLAALGAPGHVLAGLMPAGRSFADQTVRQRVRLRRGGSALRVVLSNEYGTRPLVLDELRVGDDPTVGGPASAGAEVLRGGARRWVIPAGASAVSDPVPGPIGFAADLVLSAYLREPTESATYLHSTQRTAEITAGNRLGQAMPADAEATPSAFWLTRVLVRSTASRAVVVALGDSITRGDGTSADAEQRYPDHLQRRLIAAGQPDVVVLNAGISGNRLLTPSVGPPIVARLDRDVLDVPDATHVIVLGGVNDLGLPGMLGGQQPQPGAIIDALGSVAARAAARGIRPILGTITPFGGSVYPSLLAAGLEESRETVNRALLAQTEWPVIDFAAAVADPDDPRRMTEQFDSGDGLHPGDAGARALAEAVDLALLLD